MYELSIIRESVSVTHQIQSSYRDTTLTNSSSLHLGKALRIHEFVRLAKTRSLNSCVCFSHNWHEAYRGRLIIRAQIRM